jgi:cell division protein ZapA
MTDAIKVNILDKEYIVACPEGEETALQASATHLNDKMKEIRATGKVVGADRIAVIAGLNIAHEAIELGVGGNNQARFIVDRLQQLNARIEESLGRYRQAELN